MKAICIFECKDCGPFQIYDPGLITLFGDNQSYQAITLCSYCERSITSNIDKNFVKELLASNVMLINFNVLNDIEENDASQ